MTTPANPNTRPTPCYYAALSIGNRIYCCTPSARHLPKNWNVNFKFIEHLMQDKTLTGFTNAPSFAER